jgi:putative photosynthetic complex assembly protein
MKTRSTKISIPLVVSAVFLLACTGTVVATQIASPVEAHVGAKVVAMRDLRFSDRTNGGVEVTNAADGTVVAELKPNSNNFVRALMRGLVRQRVRESQGPETPFRLTAFDDGELTLEDPVTHRIVALAAFGPTNAEAFVKLLPLKAIEQ